MLAFLELVELSNGDIALRRSDDKEAEPMVVIRFSEESRGYLGESATEVARVMMQAGVEAASSLYQQEEEPEETLEPEAPPPTFH